MTDLQRDCVVTAGDVASCGDAGAADCWTTPQGA